MSVRRYRFIDGLMESVTVLIGRMRIVVLFAIVILVPFISLKKRTTWRSVRVICLSFSLSLSSALFVVFLIYTAEDGFIIGRQTKRHRRWPLRKSNGASSPISLVVVCHYFSTFYLLFFFISRFYRYLFLCSFNQQKSSAKGETNYKKRKKRESIFPVLWIVLFFFKKKKMEFRISSCQEFALVGFASLKLVFQLLTENSNGVVCFLRCCHVQANNTRNNM